MDNIDRLIGSLEESPRSRDWLEARFVNLRAVLHGARKRLDTECRTIECSWTVGLAGERVVEYHIGRWCNESEVLR